MGLNNNKQLMQSIIAFAVTLLIWGTTSLLWYLSKYQGLFRYRISPFYELILYPIFAVNLLSILLSFLLKGKGKPFTSFLIGVQGMSILLLLFILINTFFRKYSV
jgi:hypothetical protein